MKFLSDRDKANLIFNLRKDDAGFFNLIANDDKTEVTLTLKTEISPSIWKYKDLLSVQIVAEFDSEELASCDVVVGVKKDRELQTIVSISKISLNSLFQILSLKELSTRDLLIWKDP